MANYEDLEFERKPKVSKGNLIILAAIVVVSVVVGALIGHFATKTSSEGSCEMYEHLIADADPSMSQKIFDSTSAENIREYLR